MRILVDVDGVIADFVGSALRVVEQLGGKAIGAHEVREWDIENLLPSAKRQLFWDRVTAAGFCASLDAYPGSVEAISRLRRRHDVYFVTSDMATCPTWAHERRAWLKQHFDVHYRSIVHTHAKYLVSGDALIDDKPEHIEAWGNDHPKGAALLWDAAYNRASESGVRVCGWDDVESELRRLPLKPLGATE